MANEAFEKIKKEAEERILAIFRERARFEKALSILRRRILKGKRHGEDTLSLEFEYTLLKEEYEYWQETNIKQEL